MPSNLLEFCFHNKEIYKLSKDQGTFPVMKWDKEKKQKVPTGDTKPWKKQKFSISLGSRGRQRLGFIEVLYWGDKDLVEGKIIRKAYFFLKQDKWTKKNPMTKVEQYHSKHCLIMTDFDCLIEKKDSPKKYDEVKNLSPEESIKKGMEDYSGTPILQQDDYAEEHFQEANPAEEKVNSDLLKLE